MVELRLLRYFVTVAQEKNISAAAEALHITQPTLSRQMQLLEEELGTPLFIRGKRPLALTGEGILFRRRAMEILELMEKTEEELASRREQIEGTVTIGCGELASVGLLARVMADFREKYPHVVFEVQSADSAQISRRMEDGLTDLGLLLEPVDMEKYEYLRLPVKEEWVALVPEDHPLAGREWLEPADCKDRPLILPARTKVRSEVMNWLGENYAEKNVVAVSNLSANTRALVAGGLGIALVVKGCFPVTRGGSADGRAGGAKEETHGTEEVALSAAGIPGTKAPSSIHTIPLRPSFRGSCVMAWKREQPLGPAAGRFVEFTREYLGNLSDQKAQTENWSGQ